MLEQAVGTQPHREARHAWQRSDADIGVAGDRAEQRRHIGCLRVQRVEIVAIDADDDGRGLAGDGLSDAVSEEGQHLRLDARELREGVADRFLDVLFLVARQRLQLDVELAPVRSPRVFAGLGAADLLLDGRDARVGQQLGRDASAEPPHLGQGRAGCGRDLQHEVAFAELGQELATEERNHRRGAGHQQQRDPEQGPGMRQQHAQDALVGGLQDP